MEQEAPQLPHSTDVLIVGAGPTGLALSLALEIYGVDHVLLDRRSGRRVTSRSFTLHARTLEHLQILKPELVEDLLEVGIKTRGFLFNFKGLEKQPVLDFSTLPTHYPFILIIEQDNTERIFLKYIKHTPFWEYSVTEIDVFAKDGVDVKVCRRVPSMEEVAEKNELSIHAKYVIGCDGDQSIVRGACGFERTEEKYDKLALHMVDVILKNFHPEVKLGIKSTRDKIKSTRDTTVDDTHTNWIHYYMSRESFLLVTRIGRGQFSSDDNYRILVSKMSQTEEKFIDNQSSFERARTIFQDELRLHVSEGVCLDTPTWVTTWELWRRCVKQYIRGRVILAGDAAHVHSPSGGQGMNVGMQDAFNLAWKLRYVLDENINAGDGLLQTYHTERLPVGQQVIDGSHRMHDVIMAHGKGVKSRLEITMRPGWNQESVLRISGLSYNYCTSTEKTVTLQPGTRINPNLVLQKSGGVTLAQLLLRDSTRMIAIVGQKHEAKIGESFPDFVSVVYADWAIPEIGQNCVAIIRPDGYCLANCDVNNIDQAIASIATYLCI